MKYTQAEKSEQLENLKMWFPEGSTVYTILRKVAPSGMSRNISVLSIALGDPSQAEKEATIYHPNYAVSVVLGLPLVSGFSDSVRINGCGMDMGFALVNDLARTLYGSGDSLKQRWI